MLCRRARMGASLKSFFERLFDDGMIVTEKDLRWVAHLYYESLGGGTDNSSKAKGLEEILKDLSHYYAHARYKEAA
jgi:hypothetical protein